jgi:hypothetical protein
VYLYEEEIACILIGKKLPKVQDNTKYEGDNLFSMIVIAENFGDGIVFLRLSATSFEDRCSINPPH